MPIFLKKFFSLRSIFNSKNDATSRINFLARWRSLVTERNRKRLALRSPANSKKQKETTRNSNGPTAESDVGIGAKKDNYYIMLSCCII